MFPREKKKVHKGHCWKWDFSRSSHREPKNMTSSHWVRALAPQLYPNPVATSTLQPDPSHFWLSTEETEILPKICTKQRGFHVYNRKRETERNANRKDQSCHRLAPPHRQPSRPGCNANIVSRNCTFWRAVKTHGKMNIGLIVLTSENIIQEQISTEGNNIWIKVNEKYQIQV